MQILVTFVVSLVLLIHSNQVVGELTVTATISDESAVSIGFGEFVTYQFYDSIEVSCRADPLPVNGILMLFRNDNRIIERTESYFRESIRLPTTTSKGYSERRIIFKCRIQLMTGSLSHSVEHRVGLTVRPNMSPPGLCASSVGNSVTPDESWYLLCATSLSPVSELMWSGQDASLMSYFYEGIAYTWSLVEVSMLSSPMICNVTRPSGATMEVCRLPEFKIISEPTVSISEESLSASVDSLSFSCQSNPPSRIRWVVTSDYGDYGDILDHDLTVNFFPGGELNVRIQEMAGRSNISLTGSAVPLLKINTIYCITYGRQYTRIGVARVEIIPEITPSVTTTSSECKQTTTQLEKADDVTQKEPMSRRESNDTAYIIVITILTLSTLISALSCALLYFRSKRSSEPTKTSGDHLENTNPAYEPYQPSEPASAPYMEVMNVNPSVQNTNLYQEEPVDDDYHTPSL